MWRKPSSIGAALICKSLMHSTCVHILNNFVPVEEWIDEAHVLLRKTLWSDGRVHVRKTRVHSPIDYGGMNLVDLNKSGVSVKLFFYRKLINLDEDCTKWFN